MTRAGPSAVGVGGVVGVGAAVGWGVSPGARVAVGGGLVASGAVVGVGTTAVGGAWVAAGAVVGVASSPPQATAIIKSIASGIRMGHPLFRNRVNGIRAPPQMYNVEPTTRHSLGSIPICLNIT